MIFKTPVIQIDMDYFRIDEMENIFDSIDKEISIEHLQENKYYLAELFTNEEYDYYLIKIVQITEEKVYSSGCYVKQTHRWVIDQEFDYVNKMHKSCMDFIRFYSF